MMLGRASDSGNRPIQGFRTGCRPVGFLLLGLLSTQGQADWSTFGRYSALAEIRFQGPAVRVSECVRNEPEALSRLGLSAISMNAADPPPLIKIEGARWVAGPVEERIEAANGAPSERCWVGSMSVFEHGARRRLLRPASLGEGVMGVVVLDRGIPLADLGPMAPVLELELDEKDPWKSRFLGDSRVRQHLAPRSTVKIETDAIRHTLLIPFEQLGLGRESILRDLARYQQTKRDEQREALARIFQSISPLKVNGSEIQPRLERINWVSYDRSGMRPVSDNSTPPMTEGLLGVALSYSRDGPINQIDVQWTLFSSEAQQRSMMLVLGVESFEGVVTESAPVFSFTRDEALDSSLLKDPRERPKLLFLRGPDSLMEKESLEALLLNAYQAFVLKEEEKAYDQLALSLADPLLESIYLDQRRSLLRQTLGLGGEGRVNRVEVTRRVVARPDAEDETALRSTGSAGDLRAVVWMDVSWHAVGEVFHWGHSHPRDNAYEARLGLEAAPDGSMHLRALRFRGGRRLDEALQP